jgi:hypothetical protein
LQHGAPELACGCKEESGCALVRYLLSEELVSRPGEDNRKTLDADWILRLPFLVMKARETRQKRLLWRFAVRFGSIAAFVVSALAMLFTALQWKEARRTADDAEKAMLTGQRAFVGLDGVKYRTQGLLTELDFDLRAYGTTPARAVHTVGTCEVKGVIKGAPGVSMSLLGVFKVDATFGKIEMPPVSAIMPGSQTHGRCVLATMKPGDKISIHGTIEYRDIFNTVHTTGFCYSDNSITEKDEAIPMSLCASGNDAT